MSVSSTPLQAHANLSSITWAHAVNSQSLLEEALGSSVEYIEADIVLGRYTGGDSSIEQPIMGHPPSVESDLTLESFLNQIIDHNKQNTGHKGVKLDFKSIGAFEGSLSKLQSIWPTIDFPVWINADIISGPLPNIVVPVDPARFFVGCATLPKSTLSIGWTTLWSAHYNEGSYTKAHAIEMENAIEAANLSAQHAVTFPVRAGIAAHSLDIFQDLVNNVAKNRDVTITVWSSFGDYVHIPHLQNFILAFGVDRVYLDVPIEVSSQLNLGV